MLADERAGEHALDPPGRAVEHHQRVDVAQGEQEVAGGEAREALGPGGGQGLGRVQVDGVALVDLGAEPVGDREQPLLLLQGAQDRDLPAHRPVGCDLEQGVLVVPGPQGGKARQALGPVVLRGHPDRAVRLDRDVVVGVAGELPQDLRILVELHQPAAEGEVAVLEVEQEIAVREQVRPVPGDHVVAAPGRAGAGPPGTPR